MNGVRRWNHLHPRTSTKPIRLEEYLAKERRDRLINDASLSDEWKQWFDQRANRAEAES